MKKGGNQQEEEDHPVVEPRIAVVGRPNVGKSSLVNRILREERMLVSEVAGTTRDAIDAPFQWHQRSFASSTRRAFGSRDAWRDRDRSKPSACCWRAGRSPMPMSSCW